MPPTVKFLLTTLAVNAIGFGIIVPVTPQLLIELGASDTSSATAIGGWLSLTFAVMQFIFSPIMGNLSDRFGRRPILLGAVLGFGVDFLILAFAPSLLWVFIARAIAGAFGASNAPAQSAIADITAPEDRARYFGLMGAAFGIGFVVGPAIGGLLGELGPRVPFLAAGILACANATYGFFVFKETLKPENRRPFEWRRSTPGGALSKVRTLPGIVPISIVYLFWQTSSLVYPMIWPYFCIGRYGWSEGQVGLSLSFVGLCLASAQVLLLPRLVQRFGERTTATIGITGAGLTMLGLAFASQSWMVWPLIILMASQALVHANLTAMMTRRASASTQGEMQGYASAIMALGSMIAPAVFNPLHAHFTAPDAPFVFYGAAFLLAAALSAACLPILIAMRRAPSV
jgi:MFS transporter, DHA1 family, tetracycline resistance protein